MDSSSGFLLGALTATEILLQWGWIRVLQRYSILDVPSARSSHARATPRGGGAVFMVVPLALLLAGRAPVAVMVAVMLFGALGLADDLLALPALPRLAVQMALAVFAARGLSGQGFDSSTAVVAIFIVAFVNAANFMDGVNGVSAMNALITGVYYSWLGHAGGVPVTMVLGATLAVVGVGFLPFNLIDAKVFMGDSGSYFIGAAAAGAAVSAWMGLVNPVTALAPLAVYVSDTGWTLARRAFRRAPLFRPHREHAYQRIADRFDSHVAGAMSVCVSSSLCAALGTFAMVRPSNSPWVALLIALVATTYIFFGAIYGGARHADHAGVYRER